MRTRVVMRIRMLILTLPWIVACVSAPARREPPLTDPPTPPRWSASPQTDPAPPETAWWQSFDDPHLGRLIEIALVQNRDLQAAAARIERAAAEARIAGADLKPAVGASFDASRRRQVFTGFPIPGQDVLATTSSRIGVSLTVTWEIDLWGRVRAGTRAALAEMQATEADLRGARLSIAAPRLTSITAATWRKSSESAPWTNITRSLRVLKISSRRAPSSRKSTSS